MRFDRFFRWLIVALPAGAAAFGATACAVFAAEPPPSIEARREYIENLSDEEKEDLRRKKERFDALPPAEQDRLRQLHEQISERPDCDQIQHVMQRYNQWLKTLTSSERAELLSVPPDRRMAQIKRLMSEQEHILLERLAKGEEIPPEDLKAILDWLAEFIEAHEDEILATMAESYQHWYRRNIDRDSDSGDPRRRGDSKRSRYFLYSRHLLHAFEPGGDPSMKESVVLPNEAELAELQSRLSEKTSKLLDPTKPAQSLATAQKWIRAAMLSKTGPLISDDALRRFLERHVDPRKREELESLPPHRMREELVVLYMQQPREPWSRRPGPGGPPPNFRGGNPPGVIGGSRPPRGGFRGPRDGRGGPDSPDSTPRDRGGDDNRSRD